jgi:hypothetical protein
MNETDQDLPEPGAPATSEVAAPAPDERTAEPVPPSPGVGEGRRPSLIETITNPRGFFEALETHPVSLRMPALIVLVVGAIAGISAFLVSSVLMSAMAIPGVQGLGGVIGAVGAISAVIFTLLFWVIYTTVFFAISMAFNGRGDFNRLLAYVGYGHLPQVIGGVITLLLTWSYISNLRVPSLTDPQAIQAWSMALTKDPTMRLATVVGLLFTLWSANLWIFGVRAGRKLSTRDAAITVGVPVLLYTLYIVYTLVA